MKRWILLSVPVCLMAAALPLVTPTDAFAAPLFDDVPDGHPFYDEIEWLVEEGITTGYADGTFRPGASITRQAMAAFLYRMAGEPPGPFSPPGFSDVPDDHPFATEIAWLVSEGITTGYPDGTFRPGATITRQALSAFLHRLAGEPPGPFSTDFTDVPDDHPFALAIGWMVDAEITTGYPDGTFRPSSAVTRQAIAAFLMRFDAYVDPPDVDLPPDPATVAPPLDPSGVPTFWDQVSFLIEGTPAIQTGVADGAIDHARVAVIRGRVGETDGTGLPGATVTVVDHPEWGQTISRADGGFDLAVEGGTNLLLAFELDGFLPLQRWVQPEVEVYTPIDDVVLTALDSEVTAIEAESDDMQVAQASVVSDEDGTRQNTLVVPAGVGASMEMPDGSTEPLTDLHVRATEYTVGDTGVEAMPGDLPATSGYTYAVELTVDEALDAGATNVSFDGTLYNYVDNFLEFPAGTAVPSGYYDKEEGAWKGSDDGIVVDVTAESAGMANLDVTGDGVADGAPALAELDITDGERTKLASLYAPGDSVWRVPITHFTPFDYNWPFVCDGDCAQPDGKPKGNRPPNGCTQSGSVIGCQEQTLGERIPVAGTPATLVYESDRVPGRGRSFSLPIVGASIPEKLISTEVSVSVAGQRQVLTRPPTADDSIVWSWDGKDGYGRQLTNSEVATVTISYSYPGKYISPDDDYTWSFGWGGDGVALPNATRTGFTSSRTYHVVLENHDVRGAGLGGWNLDVHHQYDRRTEELLLGTGEVQEVVAPVGGSVIDHFAGNGDLCIPPDCGEGQPAAVVPLSAELMDTGPDGSIYYLERASLMVRRIHPDGRVTTIAGTGFECEENPTTGCGTSGPAREAQFVGVTQLTVATDGTVYLLERVWENDTDVIRAIGTDGIIRHIAGGSARCAQEALPCGDGGPATNATFSGVTDIQAGSDGNLYIADLPRFRRVRPDGVIEHVYGCVDELNCVYDYLNDVPADDAFLYTGSFDIAADGSFYFLDVNHSVLRQIDPEGVLHTVLGHPDTPFCADGWNCGDGGSALNASLGFPFHFMQSIVATPDGVYFRDQYTNPTGDTGNVIRRIMPNGYVERVAGNGTSCPEYVVGSCGDGESATEVSIGESYADLIVLPGGHVVLASESHLRSTSPVATDWMTGEQLGVPSSDGTEFYVFDREGRHILTRDSLTGVTLLTFGYDAAGRVTSLTDVNGNVTTIAHDGSGQPTAIVGPYGQTTSLTVEADGYLTSITNPAGEVTLLDHDATGLLRHLTDPAGGPHTFTYDTGGRLIRDENPAGGSLDLVRTETAEGYVVTTTTAQGRVTTYEVAGDDAGTVTRTTTDPAGAVTMSARQADGSTHTVFPDGSEIDVTYQTDPRWGASDQILASMTTTQPGGTTSTTTYQREVTPSPTDVVAITALTDVTTTNGEEQVSTWDTATRTRQITTPEGRTRTVVVDAKGRVTSFRTAAGVTPTAYAYDTKGRLITQTAGTRTLTFEYDSDGWMSAFQDDRGERWLYGYDAVGRRTSTTQPDGTGYAFEYDALGDLTQVTMPSGEVHTQSFTAAGDLSGYDGPVTAAGSSSWSPDRDIDERELPGGATITNAFDEGGRWTSMDYGDASVAFSYEGTTGLVAATARTSPGVSQEVAYAYDGALPTDVTYTGPASGSFHTTFDVNRRMSSLSVTAGTTMSMPVVRDADGLVTGLGAFTLARGGPGGMISGISGAGLTRTDGYNSFGDPTSRAVKAGATTIFDLHETIDDSGRVTQRVDVTPGGGTRTTEYTYDANGRLATERVNGGAVKAFVYDPDGNPTMGPLGPAVFDAEDRVTSAGGTSYTYDDAGFLAGRGTDDFVYSARGELLSATIGAQTVDYTYDGRGRPVTRTVGGATTTFLYGNPSNLFQLTASRNAAGVLTLYYYDDQSNLFAFVRGATTYLVGTDHLGTPRVVSTTTGSVVKELQYDAWGRVLSDSAPAFDLPVGFAGGLVDPLTGLVHFGVRDYDPRTGHWMSRDPAAFGGSGNLYAYVDADPVNRVDPTGLTTYSASYYEGGGGGIEFAEEGGKFSLCVEVGLGVGGSVGVSSGGPATTGLGFGASAQASCGAAQVTLAGEVMVSDCDTTTEASIEGGLGNFAVKGSRKQSKNGTEYDVQGIAQAQGGSEAKLGGCGVQAKVYVKPCFGW